jgi:hypothetical protein
LGLKPKVVYWIYTAVVRPIVTYAVTIWWPRVKLKTSQQRTAPTAVMEVLGLHLQVEVEAKVGNYSLHCNKQWKPKSEGFGHTDITQDMESEPILQMGSDKMTQRHVYDKPFTIRLPDRSE